MPQTVCDFSFFGSDRTETPREVQGSGERLLLCSVLSPGEPARGGGAHAEGRLRLLTASHRPGIGNVGFGKIKELAEGRVHWEQLGLG